MLTGRVEFFVESRKATIDKFIKLNKKMNQKI